MKFINTLPNGVKVAVISFSEDVKIESQLTSNKNDLISVLSNLKSSESNKRNIKDSIIESVKLFLSEEEKVVRARRTTTLSPQDILITTAPRVVILATQENIESPTEESIILANDNRVAIYTIGLKLKDNEFNEGLRNIAQSTGGEFFSVENQIFSDQAFLKIAGITRGKIAFELASPFLIIILVLLLIEWILEYIRFGTIP